MIRKRSIIVSFVLIFLLAFSVQSIAANWFVDTTLATGSNNGTTMDDAWQSIETAMEYTLFSNGDKIWIRRVSAFASASSTMALGDSGYANAWLEFIGWPRNSHAISSSDWTNGSTSVNVDDADMDREKHQGRYITAPDSRVYLITKVTDASTIVIDREYVGSDASNAAATISADEDYATAQAIDDSAWTIKKTNWNADADDVPKIDFESTGYYYSVNGKQYVKCKNMEFAATSGTTQKVVSFGNVCVVEFVNVLFKSSANYFVIVNNHISDIRLRACIIEGSGSGSNQHGINGGAFYLKDVAIYNMGGKGITALTGQYPSFLRNVNIGVEVANKSHDIGQGEVYGIDVKLGGSNGYVLQNSWIQPFVPHVRIENYQKILGNHMFLIGIITGYSADVVAGSGDPYKRTGGADKILSLQLNYDNTFSPGIAEVAYPIIEHTIAADTSSKSYRYYVQLKDIAGLTADQLYLECEYVSAYDDTTEYQYTIVTSDETPAVRTGADDWSQYIEVTGIQPAVASSVHLRVRVRGYDADGYVFIDPLPYIY